jgi:23S rRNA pseudouridine2605 synthase
VTVDGVPAHLGQKIDPAIARVEVDGIALPVKPDLVYYLLYKPVGVISTTEDTHDRHTVTELVPGHTRVYPVGRLDADSEGLLLLTNDGDLTERVTHPRFGVRKTYLAEVEGSVGAKAMAQLVGGVELDDGPARAAAARVVDEGRSRSLVEVTMTEGRKREVRRMLDVVGHPVRRLVREAIGPVRDRQLKPGEWRELTLAEVRSLYAAATEQ